jgi:hypothetical protein
MSLPKKIAALAAPVAAIAFLLAVPASAQNPPASTSPKAPVDYSTSTTEAPKAKTMATRHSWTKKHTAEKKASAKRLTKASHEVK